MNTFSKSLVLTALVSFSGVAWGGLMIGSVDVGEVDPLKEQTDNLGDCGPGSNEDAELCWVNSILDPDTTYETKEEDVSYEYVNDSSSVIGFMLNPPTSYFLIKNSTWWGLFENKSNFDWAVVDTAILNAGFNLPDGNTMTISHVLPIGETVEVSEPGFLPLLALGLFAMGLKGRKIRKRS